MRTRTRLLLPALVAIGLAVALWWMTPAPEGRALTDESTAATPEPIPPPPDVEAPDATPRRETEREAIDATAQAEPDPPAPATATQPPAPEPPPDPLPPGTLLVRVHQAGAPLAGRPVTLIRTRSVWLDDLPSEIEGSPEGVTRLVTDTAGEARADALPAGSYLVAVELASGATPYSRAKLTDEAGQFIRVELGGASLFGQVLGDDGLPREGALVTVGVVEQRDLPGHKAGHWAARTGVDGSYRIEALPAGTHWVGLHLDGSSYSRANPSSRLAFAANEAQRLDFGTREGLVRWTGTLRNRAGNPLGGSLRARRTGEGIAATQGIEVGSDGQFEIWLAPGRYRVHVSKNGREGSWEVGGEVEVALPSLVHDLTIPGVRLEGRVVGLDASTGDLSARAHLEGHLYPSAFARVPLDSAGRFAFEGLEPGTWRVGYGRQPLDDFATIVLEQAMTVQAIELEARR